MDYIPPRVKLSDDTFVFLDGKWVNETYVQSALSSSTEAQQKHTHKKMHNDWTLWEENKALWDENKALRVENRALREENKTLQCLRMENKGIQVIYDDSLQQDSKLLTAFPAIGRLHESMESKALQIIREENKAIQVFREKPAALKVLAAEKKPAPALQKDKHAAQAFGNENALAQENNAAVTVLETSKIALAQVVKDIQGIQEESSSMSSAQEITEKSLQPLEENEAFQAVVKLKQTVLSLLRENQALLEEKQGFQKNVQGESKALWEENNKLKLQQNTVKVAIGKIATQLEELQQELNSFASRPELENGMKKAENC